MVILFFIPLLKIFKIFFLVFNSYSLKVNWISGFEKLNISKFSAKISMDNTKSINMFKKLHFKEVVFRFCLIQQHV